MNASCNCSHARKRRAVHNGAGWILPSIALILLPKCPLCLAATISLLFGIGLSAEATEVVHAAAIALCIIVICIFAVRQLAQLFQRHSVTSSERSSTQTSPVL